ncbi:MAG: enterobactin ABC transporter permease, partial [Rhodobacteraceae bacterium]|nr:enterobactin ABC transporter permease [Paracoccaceae bacterium]
GQFVFERLLGLQSTLTVIVELLGGLLFLFLVLRRSRT